MVQMCRHATAWTWTPRCWSTRGPASLVPGPLTRLYAGRLAVHYPAKRVGDPSGFSTAPLVL